MFKGASIGHPFFYSMGSIEYKGDSCSYFNGY
jgi:hypothetical protein